VLFRDPRALAFVLMAGGLGLVGWFGLEWYELPKWSEAEIAQSVELNLALDLQQRGPLLQPTGERLEKLREQIRAEVEAEIRQDRQKVERWIGAGLVMLVFGAGQFILSMARRR
jgi:hypothetical protein